MALDMCDSAFVHTIFELNRFDAMFIVSVMTVCSAKEKRQFII